MAIYDWNNLKKEEKNKINKARPIFIFGPREISTKRISQLVKQLSSKRNVLFGCLKNEYVEGLEGSPQFRALRLEKIKKVDVLSYYQRDTEYILKELKFSGAIFINGSWSRLLHFRPEYWLVEKKKIPHKLVSGFVNEKEAREYQKTIQAELNKIGKYDKNKKYTDQELMALAKETAKKSFDTSAQVASVLAKNGKVLLATHNVVVPFETYGMHYGYSKEKNFSPVNDQNHYDTNHSEMEIITQAAEKGISLKGTTLYVSLMPCPACARALSRTSIKRIVYAKDHSEGYAFDLFTKAGKEVERIS